MLKLAIISDTHLGFAWGEERQEDSFNNLEQSFQKILEAEADLVLLAGDIFHDRIPRQEILGRAIDAFSNFSAKFKKRPFCLKAVKDGEQHEVKSFISPIIGIWGTHERRHIGATNPLQLLEKAGLVTLLHAESILLEINSDKLGIHGLSGIPEPQARSAMQAWAPEPFEDTPNIILIHQNFRELIPKADDSLGFEDLPAGFDLFVLGHVHSTEIRKHPLHQTQILVAGSTISTQMQKAESETKKGPYIVELGRRGATLTFLPIKTRPLIYESLHVAGQKPSEISIQIRELASKYAKQMHELKPMLRIKISGVLAQNFSPTDLNIAGLMREFSDRLILNIDKSALVSEALEKQSKLLEELHTKKLSVDQMGLKILQENLQQKIDVKKLEAIFHLLTEDELEKAEAEL